jgi:formylglycine-generating enzyme required for sulfatase activity
MADCFISYRRTPSAPVATALQSKLESKYGFDAYVDTTRTDSTRVRFPERLMRAIADAPVFICLLGERDGQHTLESDWVLKEIQQAYDLRKFCIPVFQESYRPLPDMPPAVDYLLGFDGVHILDQKNIMIDESVRQMADLVRPHRKSRLRPLLIGAGAVFVLFALGMFLIFANRDDPGSTPDPPPTTAVAQLVTETPVGEPTLSGFQVLQTTEAELTQAADRQAAFDLTATAAQVAATETAAYATLLALSATSTPHPTNTPEPPTVTATHISASPSPNPDRVTRNADWTPVERDFDGVTMVLVPAGCFMMGSASGNSDEQPVHEQCFDEPFWIDKTEVTQAQFARLGGQKRNPNWFTGDNRPVERITWFEARDFCALRGVRLPTEVEWEYATRGPDALVYPWGHEWNANYAVSNRSISQGTANVGSIPAGASWVGALDMSGNVWEWTSSLHEPYPYDASDGREGDTGNRSDVRRVLRGGSFYGSGTNLRGAIRLGRYPYLEDDNFGFRCARSA